MGEYERAESQLDVLARENEDAEIGAWLYRAALEAERTRLGMFREDDLPREGGPDPVSGTLNGDPFEALTDADPRIGARLEVFASGQYTWLPLKHLRTVRIEPPRRLRDLKWIPARVETGPGFEELELGQVLLPATTPLAWEHHDDQVRLGRVTDWEELESGHVAPVGQKLLAVDDEPFPFLEIRELEVSPESSDDRD